MKRISKTLGRVADLLMKWLLTPLEQFLLGSAAPDDDRFACPVFIIGPPRSGTTLLYQVLVNRFNFVFLDNVASRLYAAPLVGIWLSKFLSVFLAKKQIGYASNYGRTDSVFGPSEAGEFWYRWFPRGEHVYVPPGATKPQSIQELRRQVVGISKKFKAPMLFKNTYNSMRIAPIAEAFPQAVFLVCMRDEVDTAQSILEGRVKRNGNKTDWFSVPPRQIDEIKAHPYWEQVVEQVYYIYRQIDEDIQRLGPERFLRISYRRLCEDTRGTMDEIARFFESRGVDVSVRNEVPENFPYSTGKKIDDADYVRLQEAVNRLWKP
ncbi:MAG: sulfotransferase [Chloroflexi bacterium]|nr:sulfotransferase [Chloroflexota bacterium]